jgi:hypothetical protein
MSSSNTPVLTSYILLVYFYLFVELAASYFISRKVLTPNPQLEKIAYVLCGILSIFSIILFIYIFFGNPDRNTLRLLSISIALIVFFGLHFVLKKSTLSSSEINEIAAKIAIGFILMTIIGLFLAYNFGNSAYVKVVFIVAVVGLMGILLLFIKRIFTQKEITSNGKIDKRPRDFLYFSVIIMMGFIALDTWGLFTQYRDPSPFFASIDLYSDIMIAFKDLILATDSSDIMSLM